MYFGGECERGVSTEGGSEAVGVGAMLSVLRRELELRGVSVAAAERAGVECVDAEAVEDAVDSGAEDAENASVVADGADDEGGWQHD